MTPGRLITLRHQLGLTQAELGLRLGYSHRTAHSWESGARPIPRLVEAVLEECVRDRGLLDRLGMCDGLEGAEKASGAP